MERKRNTRRPSRKSRNKKSNNRWHLIVQLLAFLALIVVIAWGGATIYHRYDQARSAQWQSQIDAVQNGQSNEFKQISPDIPLYVLVVGVDDDNPSQSCFVGLAGINKEKKIVDFILLPDNTKIEGRKEKGVQRLADIYGEGGVKLTRAVVEDIFHIPIPFYAVFTRSTFKQLIDDTGGISIYVERDMYHENAAGITDIDLHQGYQYLDGEQALGYMLYLEKDGQLSRVLRQERFVKLLYTSMETHFGITNVYHIYKLWGNVDSNIKASDMARLAFSFRNVPVSDINFYVLPGEVNRAKNDGLWNFDPIGVQKIIGSTNNAISTDASMAAINAKKQ